MDEYDVEDTSGKKVRIQLPRGTNPTQETLEAAYRRQQYQAEMAAWNAGTATLPQPQFAPPPPSPGMGELRKSDEERRVSGMGAIRKWDEEQIRRVAKRAAETRRGVSGMGAIRKSEDDARRAEFVAAMERVRGRIDPSADVREIRDLAPTIPFEDAKKLKQGVNDATTVALDALPSIIGGALGGRFGIPGSIAGSWLTNLASRYATDTLFGPGTSDEWEREMARIRRKSPYGVQVLQNALGFATSGPGGGLRQMLMGGGIGGILSAGQQMLFNKDHHVDPLSVLIAIGFGAAQTRNTRFGQTLENGGAAAGRATVAGARRFGAAVQTGVDRGIRSGAANSNVANIVNEIFDALQSSGGGGGSVQPPPNTQAPAQGSARGSSGSGAGATASSAQSKIKPDDFPRIQEGPYKGLLDVSDSRDKRRLDLSRVITDHSQIIQTLKDANARVNNLKFEVDIPRGPRYAIPTGSVDWNIPPLDFNRIVPYIDPNTGNMTLKVIPRYDRQAIGTALLYAGQPLEPVGGGTRYAGLDANMLHHVIAASLGEQIAPNLLSRARQRTILNTTDKDVAGPDTPFGIFIGGKDSNLNNLEALRVSVNLLKFLVESGTLEKQDADDLIKAALYKKLGANINAQDLADSPYGHMLALTGPDITLESFLDAGRILTFAKRGDLLKTVFSKPASRKFKLPYWSSISDAMTDARNNPTWKNTYGTWARNQAMPPTGYTQVLVRVDPNKGIVNTWRDWSSARFNHYSYPWEVHGDVIGIFEKLLHGGNIEWYHSVDAPELNAKAGDSYTVKSKTGTTEIGSVSSASFGSSAPPIGLIRGSVLEAMYHLPKGTLSKKGWVNVPFYFKK